MNLDIAGKKAIVCGASRGLGRACAKALAQEGVHVTIAARGQETLYEAVEEIKQVGTSVEVIPIVADITTLEGISQILKACPTPDIVITNAGRLTDGNLKNLRREQWMQAIEASLLAPLHLIQTVVEGMCDRRYGRVVNIMGSSVKAATPSLALTNGTRAALIAVVAGLAREVAQFNVTINNLLPGPTETEGLAVNWAPRAERSGKKPEDIRSEALLNIPAGRLGTPQEFAAFCAFLCSNKLGYFTGQNLVIDGGAFPGLF